MKKYKRSDMIKFAFFILFFVVIFTLSIVYFPNLNTFSDYDSIRQIIAKYGSWGFVAYIVLQLLQVVIFVIPGDFINIVGGFAFGLFIGSLLSTIGVAIGTIISFYIARWLGYGFISKIIKPEKLEKITKILDSNKGTLSMFIFVNLPFVPRDVLMYCAGLTPCNAKRLLTVYCLARIPGIIIWTSVGANVYDKNVLGLVITFLVLLLFLLVIYIIKKQIDKKKALNTN